MMIYHKPAVAILALAFVGTTTNNNNNVVSAAKSSNSYWTVYDGDAPEECVVEDGVQVDDTCCTRNGTGPLFGLIVDAFKSNCFVIPGLLGDGGGSLQSYLGCDETMMDDMEMDGNMTMMKMMMPYYGEGCYNNGTDGGVIPDGTVVEDTNVTNIGECGCTFMVSGNGCHKIRDFSSLPGFEDDTRQVFLYMDETCASKEEHDETDTSASMDNSTSTSSMDGMDGEEGTCGFGNVGNGKCFNPELCCFSDGHCAKSDNCEADSSAAVNSKIVFGASSATTIIAGLVAVTISTVI